MRPASDVLLHIIVEMATYPDPEYDCLPRNPVAIIEADRNHVREEAVRETRAIIRDLLAAMESIADNTSCQIAESIARGLDGGESIARARAFLGEKA